MLIGLIGGLVVAMITVFKTQAVPYTAPIYALLEGLFLGGVSAMFEARMPGVAIQAVGLTFGTLFCMLAAYRSGLIKATENFKLGVVAATGGICLLYVVNIVLGMFGTSDRLHPRERNRWHPVQRVRGRDRRAQPRARLRFHRAWRRTGRAEVHGVVRRVWPARHADLAVSRDPEVARQEP